MRTVRTPSQAGRVRASSAVRVRRIAWADRLRRVFARELVIVEERPPGLVVDHGLFESAIVGNESKARNFELVSRSERAFGATRGTLVRMRGVTREGASPERTPW